MAESALQFIELAELLKLDPGFGVELENNAIYYVSFDANLAFLQEAMQEDVISLLTDESPIVKRALLMEMPRLCVCFGRQKANDILLSHIITYLNDGDRSLRSAFCEAIVGIGTFLGSQSLEEFILPLMMQSVTDSEENIVEKVLNSLSSLSEIGLIRASKVKELCAVIIPLFCHPNTQIRNGIIWLN